MQFVMRFPFRFWILIFQFQWFLFLNQKDYAVDVDIKRVGSTWKRNVTVDLFGAVTSNAIFANNAKNFTCATNYRKWKIRVRMKQYNSRLIRPRRLLSLSYHQHDDAAALFLLSTRILWDNGFFFSWVIICYYLWEKQNWLTNGQSNLRVLNEKWREIG